MYATWPAWALAPSVVAGPPSSCAVATTWLPGTRHPTGRSGCGARSTLEALGLATGASRVRFRIAETLAEAVAGAAFIQESVPEVMAVKIASLAEIDAAAATDAVISS